MTAAVQEYSWQVSKVDLNEQKAFAKIAHNMKAGHKQFRTCIRQRFTDPDNTQAANIMTFRSLKDAQPHLFKALQERDTPNLDVVGNEQEVFNHYDQDNQKQAQRPP